MQEVSFEITTASGFKILGKILDAARLQLLSFEVFILIAWEIEIRWILVEVHSYV